MFYGKAKAAQMHGFFVSRRLAFIFIILRRELEFKRAVVDIEGIEQILIIDAGACQIRVIATFPVGAPTGLDA